MVVVVVGKNLLNFVKARSVSVWRETLALLCMYVFGDEWGLLVEVFVEGLVKSGDYKFVMLCYVCVGNVDVVIKYWLFLLSSRNFSLKDLYSVVEKVVMMICVVG